MEKKLVVVLLLFLVVGTAFGQTTADSAQTQKSPERSPRLKFRKEPNQTAFKFKRPRENESKLLRKAPPAKPKATSTDEVTPFYSNMPMAKLQGSKRDKMPSAKTDSSTQYHLLKKRFKVLPVPTEPEENSKESKDKGPESRK
jgi:hypothetical protein